MTEEHHDHAHERLPGQENWNEPLPMDIPDPTWVPSALAFGITLLFWGVATSPIVSGVGLIAILISLGFWIGEMCRER